MKVNNGHLDLIFREKSNGQTYLAKKYYEVPLQVMPPHYQDDDGTAFLYLLNPSGGILQNDRLLTEMKLEDNAKAYVTTPGNTKFYKMEDGHAEVNTHVTMGKNSVLEYLPEHNVPFALSETYQNNEYHLDKSSTLIASDLVTAGRISRGEIFKYKKYSSKTKIYVDGKLIAYDKTLMEPAKQNLDSLGLLEGFESNGSMYIYNVKMNENLISEVRALPFDKAKVYFGASMVTSSLMIIRFVGNNIMDIQDILFDIWSVVRKNLLNKNSVRIRKY